MPCLTDACGIDVLRHEIDASTKHHPLCANPSRSSQHLFVRASQLVFVHPSRPSQSFQAIHHEALHVLSSIFRTTRQYVRVPSAWIDAPGSRSAIHHVVLVPIFSAIHHDVLVPFFSAIRHDALVPIFSAIRHGLLVPIFSAIHQNFSAIHHGLLMPIFSAIHHDVLVPIFSAIHHDLLVPFFSAIRHDDLVPIFSAIRHDDLVPIFSAIRYDDLVFWAIFHDALVSRIWIDAPDCRSLNLLHPSDCSCKRSS